MNRIPTEAKPLIVMVGFAVSGGVTLFVRNATRHNDICINKQNSFPFLGKESQEGEHTLMNGTRKFDLK